MGEVQEVQLQIRAQPEVDRDEIPDQQTIENIELTDPLHQNNCHGWFLVILNIFFLISGQAAATLLGRAYFNQGGNSKWMATLVQAAGWPILAVTLPFIPTLAPAKISVTANSTSVTSGTAISTTKSFSIYFFFGLLITVDDLLYSYGLDYLPVSTYSLICSTQLAFNAIFSFFLNNQKFTALILNSLVLLTFSTVLLSIHLNSDHSAGISKTHYAIGFLCTIAASALYSLILSLIQFCFQRVIKEDRFTAVIKMQIYPSVFATFAMVVGLFGSGEWKDLKGEMENFKSGKGSYVNNLVWTAVAWQVCSVGTVGLIYSVSSLFSNAIGAVALPVVPILSVVFFHDKMDGIKIMAMLIGLWGFVSYIYQNYLDSKPKTADTNSTNKSVLLERS